MELLKDIYRSVFSIKPTEAQQALINADIERVLIQAEKEADRKNEMEKGYVERNRKCPRCSTGSVDRFAHVKGEGSVSGTFSLGFGSVYGKSSLDTLKVNHCPNCGHQWSKVDREYYSREKIIKEAFKDLKYYFDDDYKNNYPSLYKCGEETANGIFKDVHAESLIELYMTKISSYSWDKLEFNVRDARKRFKSIYSKTT